jgi:hypothetical protein
MKGNLSDQIPSMIKKYYLAHTETQSFINHFPSALSSYKTQWDFDMQKNNVFVRRNACLRTEIKKTFPELFIYI